MDTGPGSGVAKQRFSGRGGIMWNSDVHGWHRLVGTSVDGIVQCALHNTFWAGNSTDGTVRTW